MFICLGKKLLNRIPGKHEDIHEKLTGPSIDLSFYILLIRVHPCPIFLIGRRLSEMNTDELKIIVIKISSRGDVYK